MEKIKKKRKPEIRVTETNKESKNERKMDIIKVKKVKLYL
jgi:hypothetical protein